MRPFQRENKGLIIEPPGLYSVTDRGGRASRETGKAWLVGRRGRSSVSGACIREKTFGSGDESATLTKRA